MKDFTETTFPTAVRWLFEANGYAVEGPVHHFGAEVDLVATQLSGFAENKVYIEVTVQYVDVAKYGKDLTKLVLFRDRPGVQRLIVSSKGFTPDVRERAAAEGILTKTYDELFRSFEKCEPYVREFLGRGLEATSLRELDEVYEEPSFEDNLGRHAATEYLSKWYLAEEQRRWLVVVGEYGTGKTALTRVLQRRWLKAYENGQGTPIPFRIELRDFSKQFDARGLLHHFLDRSKLGHLPIEFVESMIANGRVVLLLDGYDEMAQYLNIRERRACLEALTELAHGGARGILTSRPNYFTEAEELRVFEVLYRRLDSMEILDPADRQILEDEKVVDEALDAFVVRRIERRLKDLTPIQARNLVERRLADDPEGASAVVTVLERVFRTEDDAETLSLSGKPVIASYLLEIVEELKQDNAAGTAGSSKLSEWQIFDLIIAKLMLRDYKRTPELFPTERRDFLRKLALALSEQEAKFLGEEGFRQLISSHFKQRVRQRSAEGATDVVQTLFDDLRSSATLTRSDEKAGKGWRFSHNTLREFLLVEELFGALKSESPAGRRIPITDTMRLFVKSMPLPMLEEAIANIASLWHSRRSVRGVDQMLSLIWESVGRVEEGISLRRGIQRIVGEGLDFSGACLVGIAVGGGSELDLSGSNASESEFVEADLSNCNMSKMDLRGAVFDGCVLRGARMCDSKFGGSFILDCDLTGIVCDGADFRALDPDSAGFIVQDGTPVAVHGESLLGYLRYRGAVTDYVDEYHVYKFQRDFDIAEKIFRYLLEGSWRQRRGIVQRGVAGRNSLYARELVDFLAAVNYIAEKGRGSALIGATPSGRAAFLSFVQEGKVDQTLARFFEGRS